jgi:hypothetical protein
MEGIGCANICAGGIAVLSLRDVTRSPRERVRPQHRTAHGRGAGQATAAVRRCGRGRPVRRGGVGARLGPGITSTSSLGGPVGHAVQRAVARNTVGGHSRGLAVIKGASGPGRARHETVASVDPQDARGQRSEPKFSIFVPETGWSLRAVSPRPRRPHAAHVAHPVRNRGSDTTSGHQMTGDRSQVRVALERNIRSEVEISEHPGRPCRASAPFGSAKGARTRAYGARLHRFVRVSARPLARVLDETGFQPDPAATAACCRNVFRACVHEPDRCGPPPSRQPFRGRRCLTR